MTIPQSEWGKLREDVGYIKAQIAGLSDIPARVDVLERKADAVHLIASGREKLWAKVFIAAATVAGVVSALTAVVALAVTSG